MISKLIVLKIGEGSLETGFPLTIRLTAEENQQLLIEAEGKLPRTPHLYDSYLQWQSSYRNLASSLRLGANNYQVTNVAVNQCQENIADLELQLNNWLQSPQLQSLWLDVFSHLNLEDTIRVVIQTNEGRLWQIPWHLWSMWQRYPQIEIALSKINSQKPIVSEDIKKGKRVRILAILGDRRNIDVERDRRVLESLPNAEVVFLDQPNLSELTPLWEQSWHILFFAGHSNTNQDGNSGCLQINPYESIDIQRLKNTLNKAIRNGLQLAIFNSCDGLGLGLNLADLNLPHTIVMREAIPDQVAQEFLKFFLQAYAQGDSLYQGVKEAKAKIQDLHHLEQQAPGSSFLPVICQNLAVKPPLWADLASQQSFSFANLPLLARFKWWWWSAPFILFLLLWFLLKPPMMLEGKAIRQPVKGSCQCPYDVDKAGKLCGGRSAYSRASNDSPPVCYLGDK